MVVKEIDWEMENKILVAILPSIIGVSNPLMFRGEITA